MIRVAVSGAAGLMGRMAAATVAAAPDLDLVATYAPGHGGLDIAGVTATDNSDDFDCDVVVEFTAPQVVVDNVTEWGRRGFHAVVGTSGFDEARLGLLRTGWIGAAGNCLVVPNFSIGAVMMMRFAEMAAPHFPGVEVIEFHHDDKPDFPSGTALATAARIAAAGGSNVANPRGRGTEVSGIPVHSIRLPGVIASQEVIFGAPGETTSIRHDTFDREAFMPGVLAAIRGIGDLAPGVTVGLDGLLGI